MENPTEARTPLPHAGTSGAEAERFAHARRRVAAIKGFYVHLVVFVLVVAGLFLIDALSGRSWWVQWVVLGWGIGVVAHAVAVFSGASRAIATWEERKVRQLADEGR